MGEKIPKKLPHLIYKEIIRIQFFFIFLLIILFSNKVSAQWSEIPDLRYTNIYCILTTEDSAVFIGGDNGMLLRSTDLGLNWENIMGNGFWVDTVLSLGKGLGYIFAGANGAGGVYRSSDKGETWLPAYDSLPASVQLNAFAFSDSILFAATDRGVYSSSDSGSSWRLDTLGLSMGEVYPGHGGGTMGITIAGKTLYTIKSLGGVVFSSPTDTILWTQISTEYYHSGYGMAAIDTNIFIATQDGIYLYSGNSTWLPRNNGLPVNDTSWLASCILTSDDSLLFAYILSSSAPGGIYVSSDLGQQWERINDSSFADFSVNTIAANKSYLFAGTQNGSWKIKISDIITSVKNDDYINPKIFYLSQNYPNPFNPSTTINYQLPEAGFVTLKIYDILGREVLTLVNGYKTAGNYRINFNARNLTSGVYIYQLKVNKSKCNSLSDFSAAKKFLLLK